jgi:cbb3-type cytochrome oxidase subunit 3
MIPFLIALTIFIIAVITVVVWEKRKKEIGCLKYEQNTVFRVVLK